VRSPFWQYPIGIALIMTLMYFIKDYFTVGAIVMIMMFVLGIGIAKCCSKEEDPEKKVYSNEMK
jgi:hypothetical protein